ncbi:MAG: NAD(P)H-dependent oxidoreductase [Rhodospirillales bacterium]
MRDLKLVSLNGSPRAPSRTETLVQALGAAIVAKTGARWRHLRLTDIAPHVMPALMRDALGPVGEAIIANIEEADIVLIGTPVYRASFTGALKHVFDLVHYDALRGRIAVLAATGGNRHHGLVTEHQLRPLLSFFGTFTVPTTVYAEVADFNEYAIASSVIYDRITQVAAEVGRLAGSPTARPHPTELFEEALP